MSNTRDRVYNFPEGRVQIWTACKSKKRRGFQLSKRACPYLDPGRSGAALKPSRCAPTFRPTSTNSTVARGLAKDAFNRLEKKLD